jgi:hypothetical protein
MFSGDGAEDFGKGWRGKTLDRNKQMVYRYHRNVGASYADIFDRKVLGDRINRNGVGCLWGSKDKEIYNVVERLYSPRKGGTGCEGQAGSSVDFASRGQNLGCVRHLKRHEKWLERSQSKSKSRERPRSRSPVTNFKHLGSNK